MSDQEAKEGCPHESYVAVCWRAGVLVRRCAKCGAAPAVVEGGPIETLRDRFAMAALTGLPGWSCDATGAAHRAYEIADAMLKARVK